LEKIVRVGSVSRESPEEAVGDIAVGVEEGREVADAAVDAASPVAPRDVPRGAP
jgi:hypothetical protein